MPRAPKTTTLDSLGFPELPPDLTEPIRNTGVSRAAAGALIGVSPPASRHIVWPAVMRLGRFARARRGSRTLRPCGRRFPARAQSVEKVVAWRRLLGVRRLFLDWRVAIPAGESPYLGLGVHVSGGAFGFLCRQHGLAADHLYGLEVVVVDADGTARSVVATSRRCCRRHQSRYWCSVSRGAGTTWMSRLSRDPPPISETGARETATRTRRF